MKEIINKYLTKRNRLIISLVVIILGTIFFVNYSLFEPIYINQYISTNVYDAPANSYFEDENFYKCVVDAYNSKNGTSLSYTSSLSDSHLQSITQLECNNKQITSAKGLDKIVNLSYLEMKDNDLKSIDVSNNKNLNRLVLSKNELELIDISNNAKLTELYVDGNSLTELDVSKNASLKTLDVSMNQLKKIDLSKNTELETLGSSQNQLEEIDVSNNNKLQYLYVDGNKLMSLDINSNVNLKELYLAKNNIAELNTSNNVDLLTLDIGFWCKENISYGSSNCSGNNIVNLDLKNNLKLTYLYVTENELTELDISNNTELRDLDARGNNLTELDVSNNTALRKMNARGNNLTKLDLSNNTALKELDVGGNYLTELDVSNNIALMYLRVSTNELTELDVSNNTKLTELDVSFNKIKKIDLSNNYALINLDLYSNLLTELDLSNNTKLSYDYIKIHGNPYINDLYLYNNNIVSIVNNIKLPSNLNWDSSTWTSYDTSIATVTGDGVITGLKVGVTFVKTVFFGRYSTTNTIYVEEVTSDKYLVGDDYIYVGNDNEKEILNHVELSFIKGDFSIDDDVLIIKSNNNELARLDILSIKFNDLYNYGKSVSVIEEISYDEFINNITLSDELGVKVYSGDNEVTSGNIEKDMIVRVYYNDEVIDEYTITDEYLEFDDNLEVDDNNKLFTNIKSGTSIENVNNMIYTNGSVSIYDKDNTLLTDYSGRIGTGYRFNIKLSNEVLDYIVSVKGDVNGDGIVNVNDVIGVSKHILKTEYITGNEYIEASDVIDDDDININDVIKIAKHIINKEEL